jgi:phosphoglycolate phosphatase
VIGHDHTLSGHQNFHLHSKERCVVRLLILDLDGTLIDSAPGIVRTFNATLVEVGLTAAPAPEVATLIGLPLDVMYRRFLPEPAWPRIAERIAAYRARYAAEEIPRTLAFPGVAATLRRWQELGGVAAVATSKRGAVATRAIEVAGLQPLLGMIVGDDQVAQKKPHPEMVLRILAAHGCRAEEALLVGDTTHDLRMGQAAGVRTAAVTYGVHDREMLSAAGADVLLDRFEDVLMHVDGGGTLTTETRRHGGHTEVQGDPQRRSKDVGIDKE